jgi:hypothetical protein
MAPIMGQALSDRSQKTQSQGNVSAIWTPLEK